MASEMKRIGDDRAPAAPPKRPRGELMSRVVDSDSAISILPAEILDRIFSYVRNVEHFRSLLQVSRFWRQTASHVPHWVRYLQYANRLAKFFPTLSSAERNAELDTGPLRELLELGQKIGTLPLRVHEERGVVIHDTSPSSWGQPHLGEQRVLYLCDGELRFFDLSTNTSQPFPCEAFFPEEREEDIMQRIADQKYHRISWLRDQYLILLLSEDTSKPYLMIFQKGQLNIFNPALGAFEGEEGYVISDYQFWNEQELIVQINRFVRAPDQDVINIYELHALNLSADTLTLLHTSESRGGLMLCPKIYAHNGWLIIETNRQLLVHYKDLYFTLPDAPNARKKFLGFSKESFYAGVEEYSCSEDGSHALRKCGFFRYAVDGEGNLKQKRISLPDVEVQTHGNYNGLFYSQFSVSVLPDDVQIYDLKNRKKVHELRGKQLDHICVLGNCSLIGDVFLFVGTNETNSPMLYYSKVGSSSSPKALLPMEFPEGPLFTFRNELIICGSSNFKVLNFENSGG